MRKGSGRPPGRTGGYPQADRGATAAHKPNRIAAGATRREHMKRTLLLSVAALTLAGRGSLSQAAPAFSFLGTMQAVKADLAGKHAQVNWRHHRHWRNQWYRHHRHHRHHRWW